MKLIDLNRTDAIKLERSFFRVDLDFIDVNKIGLFGGLLRKVKIQNTPGSTQFQCHIFNLMENVTLTFTNPCNVRIFSLSVHVSLVVTGFLFKQTSRTMVD